jgi:hypothetical protein
LKNVNLEKKMERVSIIEGKMPIIVVAPHGYDGDDENTGYIAEYTATMINAYAVINRGWERSDSIDYENDKADCNNVIHCNADVVREEFLDPILRFKNRILKNHRFEFVYIFYIHGMSNKHRKIAGDDKLDMVIGYGAGSPDSLSCETWEKNAFAYYLQEFGINVYEGKKGGPMSGWSRNNMNQYFRKWQPSKYVKSMQIEIVHELRNNKEKCNIICNYLATSMKELICIEGFSSSITIKSY